jgi:hypothetical protein
MAVRVDTRERAEGDRALDARAANDRIAEKAEQLRFISRVPMMCECSDSDCRGIVMVWPEEYRALRQDPDNVLTARGHDADRTELLTETPEYDIRRTRRNRRNGDRRLA